MSSLACNRHIWRATGTEYSPSSSVDWAETDLGNAASYASEDAPAFIVAFCDACEELESRGATVPNHSVVNDVLALYGCPYHVADGELVAAAPIVESPSPPHQPDDAVAKALSDATALVGQSGAARAIDRAHTALHGYLIHLCDEVGLEVEADAATARVFKLLRKHHPALKAQGPRSDDITRILQSFAAAADALSPIRNKASLAHANLLLDEPEAVAALNVTRTLFRYVQDSIGRYEGESDN